MKTITLLLFFTITISMSAQWESVFTIEQGDGLLDIHLISGERGIAVGRSGTIITTEDGFKTWKRVETKTHKDFTCLGIFDAGIAIAAGVNGFMERTTDGGASWTILTTSTNNTLSQITVLSPTTAIAVGGNGTILKTTDKGLNWSTVESGTQATLRSIAFKGAIGIAVGIGGVVLRTEDNGETWQTLNSGTTNDFFVVNWINETSLLMGGDSALIYRSIDTGKTWNFDYQLYKARDKFSSDEINDIQFVNENTGFMCGNFSESIPPNSIYSLPYHRIFYTTNAGKTWIRLVGKDPKYSSNENLNRTFDRMNNKADNGNWTRMAIIASDSVLVVGQDLNNGSSKVIAGGSNSPLFETRLNAATTAALGFATALPKEFMSIHAFSTSNWKAATPDGEVFTTTDAGKSWSVSTIASGKYCYDMKFKDNFGMLVADSGRIYLSHDGGLTWTPTYFDEDDMYGLRSPYLTGITIVNSTTAFCLEQYGYSDRLIRTDDAGKTWKKLALPLDTVSWVSVPYFTDEKHGWLLEQPFTSDSLERQVFLKQGRIHYTEDGGETWIDKTPYSIIGDRDKFWLQCMDFTDPLHGWFTAYEQDSTKSNTGCISVVFKTNDGGKTWTRNVIDMQPFLSKDITLYELLSTDIVGIDSMNYVLYLAYKYNNKVIRTTDGGKTWKEMTFDSRQPSTFMGSTLYRADSTTLFLFGNGMLYRWQVTKEATGVDELIDVPNHDGITLSPNPANTSFTISGIDNITSVSIVNSLGMEVSRKPVVVSGKQEIDVSDLSSGIYFVQMRTVTGMMTKPIVVSR